MSDNKVTLREGYPFAFTVFFSDGIDARYTEAKFEVRERADTLLEPIITATHATGISIDTGTGVATVSIGATRTRDLGVNDRTKAVIGELQLIDPLNLDDTKGATFPVCLAPKVIRDA